MKRILFVIMHLEMGGAEKSLVNLLNEISADDFEVDLLLIKRQGVLLKQVPDWVNIIETPYELSCLFGGSINHFKGATLAARRILGTLCAKITQKRNQRICWRWQKFYSKAIPCLEKKYDVSVAYLPDESMYYVAEKISAARKVCWIHTDLIESDAYIEQFHHYFRYFDQIVTVSQGCVSSICSSCNEVIGKVQYLPNIVSSRYIRLKAKEEDVAKPSNRSFLIVSVGRLEHVKGFDMAIKAAAILRKRHVDFCWRIIGDGSEREQLQKLITQSGLEESVFLMGLKENPYPYISCSDLVVQSSRFEGKSIALDEAKILGIPILATNYATVKDQVAPEEGWIVEMNPEAIADGIAYVIENTAERKNIKRYLQEHEYGNADVVKDYMECFGL